MGDVEENEVDEPIVGVPDEGPPEHPLPDHHDEDDSVAGAPEEGPPEHPLPDLPAAMPFHNDDDVQGERPVTQPEEAGQHGGPGGGRPQRTRVLPAALRDYVVDLPGRRRPRGR